MVEKYVGLLVSQRYMIENYLGVLHCLADVYRRDGQFLQSAECFEKAFYQDSFLKLVEIGDNARRYSLHTLQCQTGSALISNGQDYEALAVLEKLNELEKESRFDHGWDWLTMQETLASMYKSTGQAVKAIEVLETDTNAKNLTRIIRFTRRATRRTTESKILRLNPRLKITNSTYNVH